MTENHKTSAKPAIKMQACKSSNISHHGYDADNKTLAITFTGGKTYHYSGVGPEVAEKLGKAKSIGGFFASDIRNAFKGIKQEQVKK